MRSLGGGENNLTSLDDLAISVNAGTDMVKELTEVELELSFRWKLNKVVQVRSCEGKWSEGRGFLFLKNFESWGIKRQKSDVERASTIG